MWRICSKLTPLFFLLAGCASLLTRKPDYLRMDQQAASKDFKKVYLSAPPFVLTAFEKINAPSDRMVVYIEGDGYAWASRTQPSPDPTPKYPLAFYLACQDPSAKVVYLARPGQFEAGGRPDVPMAYWTDRIYSQEVIASVNTALDDLKMSLGATKISLVGYSGGAAVAVLAAAERRDIETIRTVAGNLSTGVFVKLHHISSLQGSLDPSAQARAVRAIPQLHFVGDRDTIVPMAVADDFLDREGDINHESMVVVAGVGHQDGWVKRWRQLLNKPFG